jgi:hypothetical protein
MKDPTVTTDRAKAITDAGDCQHWIVASTRDCLDLLAGRVPPDVRRQAASLLHREPTESAAAYAARLHAAELEPCP